MDAIFASHPEWKILSKHKLVQTLKLHSIHVAKKVIDQYYSQHALHQVYKKPSKPRMRFKINSPPYSYQVDIVILPHFAHANRGVDRFLLCIEILSKKAFAYALKSNKMSDVCDAYKSFLAECKPKLTCAVYGDAFFDHKDFHALNKAQNINVSTCVAKAEHLTRVGGNKLGVVDRMTRTLKQLIQKHMSLTGDCAWSAYLGDLITMYNNTPHVAIGHATPHATFNDFWKLRRAFRDNKSYNNKLKREIACMFKPGNPVRVLMQRPRFEKEGPNFSEEMYTVKRMEGNRFVIADSHGAEVQRRYAECEMLKCDGVRHENEGAHAVLHATEKSRITKAVVHKEQIARNVVAANKIIRKSRSKKPIATLVKDKLKRPQPKGEWYVVQPGDDGMPLRDRSKTAPTEWWKS